MLSPARKKVGKNALLISLLTNFSSVKGKKLSEKSNKYELCYALSTQLTLNSELIPSSPFFPPLDPIP